MVDVVVRMTTKVGFLTDPHVVELSEWIAARFRTSSGWMHGYVDRKSGAQWSCRSLAETKEALDGLRHDLRDAVERECTDRVVEDCEHVLRWGGVSAHNVSYLTSRRLVIVAELQRLSAVLAGNRLPLRIDMLIDPDDPATECRMNAGFVKIYSLLCEYCVMYDGRVGAALGFLVRQFCDETRRSEVPPLLALGAALFRRTAFSPIHRPFCSRTITFRFVLRGDSAPDSAHPALSGGQPGLITAPGRFGRPLRPLDIRAAFWYGALGREMPLRWP